MSSPSFETSSPPECKDCVIIFPAEHVVLVTICRADKMNTTNYALNWYLQDLWQWFDDEPALRVAIVTGQGEKAFCAGSDLLEIEASQRNMHMSREYAIPSGDSAGLSRRVGKKPVLAAVNGLALGGGFEIVLNWYVSTANLCFADQFVD